MQFSGTVEIAAPRDKVWEFVSDPMQMGLCGPGVEKVEQIDEDHFRATAKVSVGPVSARFTGDGEFTERVPPERAVGRARGKAPGSAVDGTAQMTLRDGDAEGTTVMDWTADVQISGMLASLGARLIEGTANKLVAQTFDCVKSKLETPVETVPTPPVSASETDDPMVAAGERQVPAVPDALSAAHPVARSVSRPMSVAFLPLALAMFVILSFVIAAWTLLAAT